jgi:hypothetical protein
MGKNLNKKMPNQYSHPWTKEEIDWLKNEYPYLTKEEVVEWGKEHGRTYKAIIDQASALELKKRENQNLMIAN